LILEPHGLSHFNSMFAWLFGPECPFNKRSHLWVCLFSFLGILCILKFLYNSGKFGWLHLCRKADLSKYGAKNGSWAVVTGASEGIGRGFAEALASRGFNVVLISRSVDNLKRLAKDIEDASSKRPTKVQTKVVPCDCSDVGVATFTEIRKALEGLDVAVLVNNVGVNTAIPTPLEDTPDEEVERILNVNVRFTTKLTKMVIPILKRRSKSLILNLSSTSGYFPVGLMPVYSATKAYLDAFSKALSQELKPLGIDCISIVPHYVVSAMSRFKKPTLLVPTANQFAQDTLTKIGRGAAIFPYVWHDVYRTVIGCLPSSYVASTGYKMMKAARAKMLARANKGTTGEESKDTKKSKSS